MGYIAISGSLIVTFFTTFPGAFSPGNPGPFHLGLFLFISSTGFLLIFYTHVRYLKSTGRLRILNKEVFGRSIERIVALVMVVSLIIGNISFILENVYEFNFVGDGPTFISAMIIVLVLPTALFAIGVIYFNILFTLIGPAYILTFYLYAVRGSEP